MTIYDRIRDEKLQYNINREAAKISALSCGKIDKYEYFTGAGILPFTQIQIIDEAKFTYSPFEELSKKKEQKKEVDALKSLNISNKANELKKIENIFSQNQTNDLIRDRL